MVAAVAVASAQSASSAQKPSVLDLSPRLSTQFLTPSTNGSSRRMALHQAEQRAVVPLLPTPRRRSDDDVAQAVLEQQPSMCGARQCPRREVSRRPLARQSFLPKGPDAATSVANLTRERDGAYVPVRVRRGVDEVVAWREDESGTQASVALSGRHDRLASEPAHSREVRRNRLAGFGLRL